MAASRLSTRGLNFIAGWEGFRADAYQDVGGVWTIGYGHTRGVHKGDRISRSTALNLLHDDIAIAERAVRSNVNVAISQERFDALTSFVYNVGAGAFSRSNLLRKLNAGDYPGVPRELLRWDKVNGRPIAGLTRRRKAEAALWS